MRKEPLQFGPFVLDPSRCLLFAGDRQATLSTRATTILATLIEAGGEVVSKTTLMDRSWPDVVVEEGNLAVQVSALRKQLGALAADGREWILTVPRVGYRLLQPVQVSDAEPMARSGMPAIAVLPFDTLSPEQDHFADGLTEELTTALSRFRTFAVVARSSGLSYRGWKQDLRQIGRELGASYLLDGAVRRSGDRIRITTHLVDAATGTELWAERFEGQLADIFEMEDRITEAVVGFVEPTVRSAEIERARRKRPTSLGAYDLYLQALPLLYDARPDQWTEALLLLKRAIAIDPDFAPALAAAAWTHEKRVRQFMPPLGPEDAAEALNLARRAMAADSGDATVLAVGGWVPIALNGEFDTGLALARRALEMNPSNLVVLNLGGFSNIFAGDLDEAAACFHKALRLSPGAPDAYWNLTGLGQVHLHSSEFEEAISWCARSLAVNPNFPMTIGAMAASYALLGQMDEARAMMARLMQIKPQMTLAKMASRRIRDRLRWRNTIEGLRLAGMPQGEPVPV